MEDTYLTSQYEPVVMKELRDDGILLVKGVERPAEL